VSKLMPAVLVILSTMALTSESLAQAEQSSADKWLSMGAFGIELSAPNQSRTMTLRIDTKEKTAMVPGGQAQCFKGTTPVEFATPEKQLVVMLKPSVSFCEQYRYVIDSVTGEGTVEISNDRGATWTLRPSKSKLVP
jgi:hypothetical protein